MSALPDPRPDTPRTVLVSAALAWGVAGLALLHFANLWVGDDRFSAAGFFLGLGGGSMYLALALPRRIVSAWRGCRRLASAIGTINLVVLPSLVVGYGIAVGYAFFTGAEASFAERTTALATAVAATALPWAFYHALGDPRVRSWFCVADYQ